jgi:hypothetical protein
VDVYYSHTTEFGVEGRELHDRRYFAFHPPFLPPPPLSFFLKSRLLQRTLLFQQEKIDKKSQLLSASHSLEAPAQIGLSSVHGGDPRSQICLYRTTFLVSDNLHPGQVQLHKWEAISKTLIEAQQAKKHRHWSLQCDARTILWHAATQAYPYYTYNSRYSSSASFLWLSTAAATHSMSQQPNLTPQDAMDADTADSEFPSTDFPLPQHHHSDTQTYWPTQRSFSMPDASQLPLEALDPLPSGSGVGEKKKNKLGYHRTPVACSKSVSC